jgi:hypothetical protein
MIRLVEEKSTGEFGRIPGSLHPSMQERFVLDFGARTAILTESGRHRNLFN